MRSGTALWISVVGLLWLAAATAAQAKPNVILILADDLGASELGCYGNRQHATPNLDRMAQEGLRLDTFYAMPLCTTTRLALMTGQYGFRNGYLGMNNKAYVPAPNSPQRDIGLHFTHADLMKAAGYVTAMVGKWQLSGSHPTLIHDAGFDEYRMWAYAHNLPKGIEHPGRWEGVPGKSNTARFWYPSLVENGKYIPTVENDYGPDLINEFVFDFMKRNRERPFFVYYSSLLTHGPHEQTPDPRNPGKRLPKGFQSNLEYLDHLMGKLIERIRAEGLDKNTIVIFIGDNGTAARGKGSPTELGSRVPFIAWCPALVKPKAGAERVLADVTDIMPTLAEITGASLPADRQFDGRSLAPILFGHSVAHRSWIYSHLNDGRVLRDQRWLLEIPGENQPEKFYDCGNDRTGDHYKLISLPGDEEAQAARKRFTNVLSKFPVPRPRDVSRD